ncbi:uncharacterized protein K460DRAFT_283505 [Cucurbitaria berberidis CBS 394.84]|uniref:RNase III domain-containing protein n=1 Tax=Cucurbitaria berberidis CBS 394.84 TaxID=1168544 RepID=A0A9P4GHI6_9PLEO|nr:uncharacterized protein K460DRAFT_283505 [Cucurbitaria berberidis CBS 394.84]KAF1846253.1 hypothetical protein K460DRAFT_283505 [Cucurbitaria berberidis CBS 394.84]
MLNVDSEIAAIEQIFGYTFTNKFICAEALQMVAPLFSVCVDGTTSVVPKNVNLAILGDSILMTVLCQMWDEHRDDQGRSLTPEDWTTIRNEMLGNHHLASLGFELGVDACILKNASSASAKMVATTVEAVIGAVCRDVGDDALSVVRAIVEHIGLNAHPLLMVKFRDPLSFDFSNIQMITNVPTPSSPTWGTPGRSTRRPPEWLTGSTPGLF